MSIPLYIVILTGQTTIYRGDDMIGYLRRAGMPRPRRSKAISREDWMQKYGSRLKSTGIGKEKEKGKREGMPHIEYEGKKPDRKRISQAPIRINKRMRVRVRVR